MFFLFLRPSRIQKSGLNFFLHFFIFIFNMGISIDISFYPYRINFSQSDKPIFTKFGVQVYDVPQKTPGKDSPVGGATATNSKSQYMIRNVTVGPPHPA